MIMGFATLIPMVFFMRETYPPTILISKADSLRRRTKNWAIHAKQEEVEIDLRELLTKNLTRPMRMFFTDPILFVITIYLSFVYGLLYIFLTAYPLVFQGVHGFTPGVSGLALFGMALGMILAGIASALVQPSWRRKYRANNGKVIPEWRMPLNIVGGVAFTIGLFCFGWTGTVSSIDRSSTTQPRRTLTDPYTGNYESVHWIVPTLSGLFTGFGLLAIFMQLFMYLVDAYLAL